MDKIEIDVSSEVARVYPDAYVFAQGGSVRARCLTYFGGGEPCVLAGNMVVSEKGVALRGNGVIGCRGCINGGSGHDGGK